MKEIDKIAFIEIQKGRILSTRSRGKDKYYIPGGKREAGESDEETLIREIKEELQVDILQNTIQYVGTFSAQAHGHKRGVNVKMTCYTGQYNGELKPDNEIEEMVWLNYADLGLIAPVDKIIFKFLHEQGQLE